MENKQSPKTKKRFNWRTTVWPKYLLSFGIVALASAITLGIFKYNSKNPKFEKGIEAKHLSNAFLDPKATPILKFVDSSKQNKIADFNPKVGEDGEVEYKGQKLQYGEFLKKYYTEHKALPFLNIKYGSFDFYNEYLEAVNAKDFYDFTQWFMQNVSWGPEIITLKEFSIVKGVELKGNNITLGSHANQDKEYTTIKFFPDAFFGSIPLHSTLGGEGNAADSLLYRINKKLLTSEEIAGFLKNTAIYNAHTNLSLDTIRSQSFRTIGDKRALLGKTIYAVKGKIPQSITDNAYGLVEKARLHVNSDYISVVYAKDAEEAKAKFKEQISKFAKENVAISNEDLDKIEIEERKIVGVDTVLNQFALKDNASDKYLRLIFDNGQKFVLFDAINNTEYYVNEKYEKSNTVESIDQGYDHSKRMYINMVTDVESLYDKFIKENVLFDTEKFTKLKDLVAKLERSSKIKDEIIAQNTIVLSGENHYKEAIKIYEDLIAKSKEKIKEAETKIADLEKKIEEASKVADAESSKPDAQGDSENEDEEAQLNSKEYKVFKYNKEKEEIKLELEELKLAKDKALKKIEEYKAKVATPEEVAEANAKILALQEEKSKLDEDKIKTDIQKILKRAGIEGAKSEAIIGIISLHEELKTSPYNEFKQSFNSNKEKAEYVLELRKYAFKHKPKYTLYSKILDGDNFAKLVEEKDDIVLYSTDLAYTPAQLIALDELNSLISNTQVNWREYANIDGFIRSQHDEPESKRKSFYVYSSKINKVADEFNEDEKIKTELSSIEKDLDAIKSSFNSVETTDENTKLIEKKREEINYDTLKAKYEFLMEELTNLGEKHQANVSLLIRVAALNTFATLNEDNSKGKTEDTDLSKRKYWKQIFDIIDKHEALKSQKTAFEKIMKDPEALSKNAQQEVDLFKVKVTRIVSEIFKIYQQQFNLYSSVQSNIDQFTKQKRAEFNQKISEIIAKLNKIDLSNPEYSSDLQKLFEYAVTKADEFSSTISGDEKETAEIITKFKDVVQYVQSLYTEYEVGDISQAATAYFNVLAKDIYWKYDSQTGKENHGLKFIATLFNPIINLGKQISEYNEKLSQHYNEVAEEIQKEIAEIQDNDELKAQKEKEFLEAKNLMLYYHEQTKNYIGHAEELKNISEISEISELFELDFDEQSAFDVEESNETFYKAHKSAIDNFNKSIERYIEVSLKQERLLKGFITKIKNDAETLFTKSDKFSLITNEYSSALEETIRKAKEILKGDHINKTVYAQMHKNPGIELNKDTNLIVAETKIELVNKLTKLGILKTTKTDEILKFSNENIHEVRLSDVQKNGTKLLLTLQKVYKTQEGETYTSQIDRHKKTEYIKFNIDAKIDRKQHPHSLQQVKDMLKVAGYQSVIQPSAIKEEGSKIVTDKNGKAKTINTYSVFVEAYDGFTDELLSKVPFAAEWLKGEHLVKTINDKGEFEYKVENGEYLGFRPDSRIGLWSLIMMNNPKYKGLSVDFLKFVAAHEYGHHITLNSAQDLGDKGQKPLFGSALVPGATPNINNYYSREVIDLYLKARTHLGLNSSPLLNQPNVVSENNEGEYLLYNKAKKVDGKIVIDKSTLENPVDVWGHEIGDENLKKAMENPKRRFLQTYEGLIKATEERRKENGINGAEDQKWLQPFDLWLMNTLDQNSGTLNPTKFSDEKNPAKYMVKGEDGKYSFKAASLDMLKGVLKDGQGNLIDFETVNGNVVPKIVEGERDSKGNFIKITKVLVYNEDGTPIVNVPIGIDLSEKDTKINPFYQEDDKENNITVKWVNDKINEAINTISALIVKNYSINGWDSSTTNTSINPKTQIAYPLYGEIFRSAHRDYHKAMLLPYIDYIKGRNKEKGEVTPDYVLAKYYGQDGSVVYDRLSKDEKQKPKEFRAVFQENYYVNPFEDDKKTPETATLTDVITSIYLADGVNYGRLAAGAKLSLWLSPTEQYLPNVKLKEALTNGFLTETFSPSILKQLGQKPLLAWYAEYSKGIIGHKVGEHIYLMVNGSDEVVNPNPHSDRFPAFWEMKAIKINEALLSKDIETSLFNSFFIHDSKGNKQTGFNIKFEDYKTFVKFASVDTTKAILDPQKRVVNWDIDYVAQRFDIDKFANNLKASLVNAIGLSSEEKARLTSLVNGGDKQALANEIMKRFTNSKLAMFVKDLSLGEIYEAIKKDPKNELRYGWIFDKELGYGLWKSEDVKAVSDSSMLKREDWEISVKELFDTFAEFAKENNVNLNQFTIYDELIFDNKVQMYTTQLHYNFQQEKFGMVDILLAFAKGFIKKARPTEDVEQYFKTKTERKFNEFFSDYTYSFAEVINRDNLQITYSPSTTQFANLPSFIRGINEANTGLEYVIDGQPTAKWNDALIRFTGESRKTVRNTIIDLEQRYDAERKLRADKLGTEFIPSNFVSREGFSDDHNKSSNYFGQFKSINNGWFKDRWYRDMLNFRLYDDNGEPIYDDTIRIKDLEGNAVTNRPQAYWQYYIQSQGVGKRNLSNIWRNTDKDAVALFGYLNNEDAKKANYLVFEDVETGEIKTLKLNKENSSNMFYYKTQHIENETKPESRHWLKDEKYDYTDINGRHKGQGFTAWVSDYAIMSNYANRLLTSEREYKIYFAQNPDGKKTLDIDLGAFQSVSENGKTFSQAPVVVYKKDIDGKKVAIIRVGKQFNGTK
ncbi:membrane protein [Mycoplasmopsis californica]|uniref:Membrane protein n=1 Tax=Mycoplasmopsis californica TaxID=2113 RepID=A0A059XVG8_9BACT|nr:PDxFFG protein [Mycoplasmopsis californica]AIA29306.1 membrane protein [Mycoplasmopsis californica]